MANRTHYLQYYIQLDDKAIYDAAEASVAASAGWLTEVSPETVATTYSATLVIPPAPYTPAPCVVSTFFGESFNYPRNVARFTRKSGGWFGIPLLFGDTHTYIWAGDFVYAGTETGEPEIPSEPSLVAMPTRMWVEGFENNAAAGSLSGNVYDLLSPLASRHQGGYGMACRGGATHTLEHRGTESGHAAYTSAWERLYVRLRVPPTSSQTFWQTTGATSANAGIRLRFTLSGQIELCNVDSVGTFATIGTSAALEIGRWYKLDILYKNGAAPNSFAKLYIGGVSSISITGGSLPAGTGLTQVQNITGSTVSSGNTTGHGGSWDLDDWIGSELPLGGANPNLFPQRDWNTGSKVVPLIGKAAAGSNGADWAGPGGADVNDWRFSTQRPAISTLIQGLTTSVASPRLAVVSNADRAIDLDPMNRGLVAASIGAVAIKLAPAANDRLYGLKLPSAAEVTVGATQNEPTTIASAGRGRLVHSGGLLEPVVPMAGAELSYTGNSTAASSKSVYNLVAQVECVGNFYIEDYVPQTGDPSSMAEAFPKHWINDLHQWPFADGPWAPYGQSPPSIVVTHARTYVGNGKTQTLAFRTPPTWIMIRNTATHEQTAWYVASPGSRTSVHEATRSSSIPRVYIDPNFTSVAEDAQSQQTLVVIAGNNVAINSNGVTYNCIAWCDAGQRFSECGALWEHGSGPLSERVTTLNNDEFTPELVLLQREQSGNATTSSLLMKGLGLATQQANLVNAASIATAFEMRTGSLATPTGSGLYASSWIQQTFLAFRRDDGSEDTGIKYVMQLASWTGDGTASRTISLGPATGRRPMWAIIVGSNGTARLRDASHTSTNSVNVASDTNDGATGITGGGVDSISVGSALNTAGVLYECLVFPGCDATAGNNGWGINCESIPVEPHSPTPPYPKGPTPPTEPGNNPNPCGTPGLVPTGTITQCAGPSTLVINAALSQLGVTKQLVSTTLNTEVSQEATVCRLHFDEDVRKCLRDFPWAFATRYLKLTAIGGPAEEQDRVQAYSTTAAYTVGMVVLDSGTLYYCIQAGTGQALSNPLYWSTEPVEEFTGDWLYAYLLPSDYVFARRIVNPDKSRRDWDLDPPKFRIGSWGNNPILYANELNVELEYTHISGCVAYQGDALFRSALSWRHAHSIAPGLSRDAKLTGYAWEMYQRLLRDARASSAQEQQQSREGDVDWIAGRN